MEPKKIVLKKAQINFNNAPNNVSRNNAEDEPNEMVDIFEKNIS